MVSNILCANCTVRGVTGTNHYPLLTRIYRSTMKKKTCTRACTRLVRHIQTRNRILKLKFREKVHHVQLTKH